MSVRAAAVAVLTMLLPGVAAAQSATADGYNQMLAYLTHSRLDGQVLAGASGSIKLNQAAGDLNRQYNGHALASGGQAAVQGPSISVVTIGLLPIPRCRPVPNWRGRSWPVPAGWPRSTRSAAWPMTRPMP